MPPGLVYLSVSLLRRLQGLKERRPFSGWSGLLIHEFSNRSGGSLFLLLLISGETEAAELCAGSRLKSGLWRHQSRLLLLPQPATGSARVGAARASARSVPLSGPISQRPGTGIPSSGLGTPAPSPAPAIVYSAADSRKLCSPAIILFGKVGRLP